MKNTTENEIWYITTDNNSIEMGQHSYVNGENGKWLTIRKHYYDGEKWIVAYDDAIKEIHQKAIGLGNARFLYAVYLPDCVEYLHGPWDWCYPKKVNSDIEGEFIMPKALRELGPQCFYTGGLYLKSIVFYGNIEIIGKETFRTNRALNNIKIYAKTAPTLGSDVFKYVPSEGVLECPYGSDYSTWMAELPEGWVLKYIDVEPEPRLSYAKKYITYTDRKVYKNENQLIESVI